MNEKELQMLYTKLYGGELEQICKHKSDKKVNLISEQDYVKCTKCGIMFKYIPQEEEYLKELSTLIIRVSDYIENCKTFYTLDESTIEYLERTKEGLLFTHRIFDIYLQSDDNEFNNDTK